MSGLVLLGALLLIALAEAFSRREDLRHLHVVFELDSKLVEPGEETALRCTVYNTSPWPLLYAGLTLRLDPDFRVCEDEDWRRVHLSEDFTGSRIDYHFYLLPHRKFSAKIRLNVSRRGLYDLGRYYLESGDLLGLRPVMRSGETELRLICTAAACDAQQIAPLGGTLGDISVRRFIHEDPSLLLGYREYTGYEPMKQISWTQTAKAGQLMVRQYDHTTDRVAIVLVNMYSAERRRKERCLEITRTVCERLEAARVPYAMYSNGDLRSVSEGLGRNHLFLIQRRIGLSRLTGYTGFQSLVDACLLRRRSDCSFIVITPDLTPEEDGALARLRRFADHEPCVLYGGDT